MTDTGRRTVLIVDDDLSSAQTLASILEAHHDVLIAHDGFEALHVAAEVLPDLILLDIRMPRMDGYVACNLLKSDPLTRNVPVIFVTAMDLARDVARGFEVGATDYITKPIIAPIVVARVRNHLQLKRYRDLLEEMSAKDPLTEIANRRRFDELLVREWQRAVRMGSPLSIMLLDIDHFKQYNDHYGHGMGDDCLQEVAQSLAAVAHRPTDLVARYGGEEFVCLLPDTDHDGAQLLAERCREAVESLGVPHAQSSTAEVVTVSAGAATQRPTEADDPAVLLNRADELLYEAKNQGRNRVRTEDFTRERVA